jgi:hypothetical protein
LPQLLQRAVVDGLQPPLLGRRKLGRDLERAEIGERLPDAPELRLQMHGSRRQSRTVRLLGAQLLERRAKHLLAIDLVRSPVRLDQVQGFAGAQAVLVDALQQRILIVVRKLRQRVRQRRSDRAARQMLLAGRRQLRAKGDSACYPLGLVAQKSRHLPGRPTVILHQRADHPRLIQRRRGTRRRVGRQQQTLVLRGRAGGLHHHRHKRVSTLSPIR